MGAIFGAKIGNKDQCNLWRVPFMETPEEVHSFLNSIMLGYNQKGKF